MDSTQKVKINEVRKHLSNAEIVSAIQLLNEILRNDPSLGDLAIRSFRDNNMGENFKNGYVDFDFNAEKKEINRVVRGLLILLEDIEKHNIIQEKILRLAIDLKSAKYKDFTLLLMGRTGVGKSSTINSLIGQPIAPISDYMPMTKEIEEYRLSIEDTTFHVIDTPGLCDDLPEEGNDEKYMHTIKKTIKNIDILLYITQINESRIRSDEKNAIKLITQTFTENIWKNSIFIFTYSDTINDNEKFKETVLLRTKLLRETITKSGVSIDISMEIPSVAISNTKEFTPDGERWLSELYTVIIERISQEGFAQFLLANMPRVEYTNKAIINETLQVSPYYLQDNKYDSNVNKTNKKVAKIYIDENQSERIITASKKSGFWDKIGSAIESIRSLIGKKSDKNENNAIRNVSRSSLIKELQKRCNFVDAGSGVANERFLIFRSNNNPWIIQKGNLIDWSNDKYLRIQEKPNIEIKNHKNEDYFFDKLLSALTQTISEMGSNEAQKMMAQKFDIQWKNISGIGK